MPLIIAAIRSGTDPVARLPEAAFHRTLEDPILCPKCSVSYNLVVDYDATISRFFDSDARPLITLLRKAVFMGHSTDHRITHFETNGVIVKSFANPTPAQPSKRS